MIFLRACMYCRVFLGFKCGCKSERITVANDPTHRLRCDACGSLNLLQECDETTGCCDACHEKAIVEIRGEVARPAGIEPATTGLEGRCSIHLSYGRGDANSIKKPCEHCMVPLHRSSTASGVVLFDCVNSDCPMYLGASRTYAQLIRWKEEQKCAS
jgi:hypothetical protein